jgi:ligand-binding sensor domain-containing protein
MNIRSLSLFFFLLILCSAGAFAQNLFPQKMDACTPSQYCMDCGTPKATCDSFTLSVINDRINHRFNFNGGSGSMTFQVLVNANRFSCVLSHTDITKSQLSTELVIALNTCLWKPAIVDGKPVDASVNVVFTIANGKISGKIQRMDLAELKAPDAPVVYNRDYKYQNPSIKTYDFTSWNRYNSPLPDNVGQACLVDDTNILWYATAQGLTRFDGTTFLPVNEFNSPFTGTTPVQDMVEDKDKNIWMYANKAVYMCNKDGWKVFDSVHLGIPKPYRIVAAPTGELFFPSSKGLLIVRNGKVRLIDSKLVWQLPSNNVLYSYYDTKGRLWMGTDRGSIMMDKKQKVIEFNKSNSPLNNTCITNVIEDDKGNMYFTMTACRKPPGDNDEEGIAVMTADGKWSHYNDKNSGLPANQVNNILYDKFDHALWIGTQKAGLVRFDLKGGWENYTHNNSAIPGPNVIQIAQDSKGTIYGATTNGMFRLAKK